MIKEISFYHEVKISHQPLAFHRELALSLSTLYRVEVKKAL